MLYGRLTVNPVSAGWNTAARYSALSAGRYDLVVRQGGTERVRAMLSSAGLLPAGPR
jgi:hypothetical protein